MVHPLQQPQAVNVNLEISLPVDLAHLRDGPLLHAPLAFVAPLALGMVIVAKAFAAAAPPPDSRQSAGRRHGRSVDPDGPDLSAVLSRLNIRDAHCQAMVVCETHRLIGRLPPPLLHQYRRVSGRLRGVHDFSAHATRGLDGHQCHDTTGCRKTPLQLLLDTGLIRRKG